MSGVPAEVDFAARYLAGDWTEDPGPPEIVELPGIWWFNDPDGVAYSATAMELEGLAVYCVEWDNAEGTVQAYVRQEPDGTFAQLMWEDDDFRVVARSRLDLHDTGYVIVDLP
jgi:hypothetical protein